MERQQLIRLLESQAAQIKNNKQKAERLEDEMDFLKMLESIELTQQQVIYPVIKGLTHGLSEGRS